MAHRRNPLLARLRAALAPGAWQRGSAAVEFAFAYPVMVLAWLGMADYSILVDSSRKTVLTASALSDLVAQYSAMTDADVTNLVSAAQTMLAPLPSTTADMTIEINSIGFDASAKPALNWRRVSGGFPATVDMTQAKGMGLAGESVVQVTLTYRYHPLVPMGMVGNVTFTEKSYSRPRLTTAITMNGSTTGP